jgi:rhodanese-related sulfurtransferase
MPTSIELPEIQRFMRQGAQIVDVLPADEYDDDHLPGAINIPLKQLDRQTTRVLEQGRPIVVYCHDFA